MQNWNRLPYFRVATNPTSANARIPSLSRGDLWISHTLQGPCKSDLEHSFRVSYFPHTLQKSTASCAEQIYAYLKSGRKAEDMWRQGGETRFVFVWTPFEVKFRWKKFCESVDLSSTTTVYCDRDVMVAAICQNTLWSSHAVEIRVRTCWLSPPPQIYLIR